MALACLSTTLGGAVAAAAVPSSVIIDKTGPELSEGDQGGGAVTLGFTNLTSEDIRVSLRQPNAARDCMVSPDTQLLKAETHTDVKVSATKTCLTNDTLPLRVVAPAAGVDFNVTGTRQEKTSSVNFDELLVFPIGFGILIVVVLCWYFFIWNPPAIRPQIKRPKLLLTTLPYADPKFDFKDSWASNATAAGALLTGVVGSSDVVKAAIGKDADDAVALATIGAAMAVAIIGAGPIVALASRGKGKKMSVAGVLLMSAITMTGGLGQIYIMWATGKHLEIGWLHTGLPIAAVLAGILLVAYTWRAVSELLNDGLTPEKPKISDAVKAARVIADALKEKTDVDEEDEHVKRAVAYVDTNLTADIGAYSADEEEPTPRRRGFVL